MYHIILQHVLQFNVITVCNSMNTAILCNKQLQGMLPYQHVVPLDATTNHVDNTGNLVNTIVALTSNQLIDTFPSISLHHDARHYETLPATTQNIVHT